MDEHRLADLKAIRIEAQEHSLPIEQASYWPHNRIVWAGPNETPQELADLVSSLARELKRREMRTEERKFSAHVTLIRKARDAGELPPLPAVGWPVEECVLVRSRPSAGGSRYEIVGRFPLRKS